MQNIFYWLTLHAVPRLSLTSDVPAGRQTEGGLDSIGGIYGR